METRLFLHSDNGAFSMGKDRASVDFSLRPPLELEGGVDFYAGLRYLEMRESALLLMRNVRVEVLVEEEEESALRVDDEEESALRADEEPALRVKATHQRDIFAGNVRQLAEALDSWFGELQVEIRVLAPKTGKISLVTGREGVRVPSWLSHALGFSVDTFRPRMAGSSKYVTERPSNFTLFYFGPLLCEIDPLLETTGAGGDGDTQILHSRDELTTRRNYLALFPLSSMVASGTGFYSSPLDKERIVWVRLGKRNLYKLRFSFSQANTLDICRCLPDRFQFVAELVIKRRLSLTFD
jgi:hypothetical protein